MNIANETVFLTIGCFEDELILNEKTVNSLPEILIEIKNVFSNDFEFIKFMRTLSFLKAERKKKLNKNILYYIPAIFNYMIENIQFAYANMSKKYQYYDMLEIFNDYMQGLKKVKYAIVKGNFLQAVFYYKEIKQQYDTVNEKIFEYFFSKTEFKFLELKIPEITFKRNTKIIKISGEKYIDCDKNSLINIPISDFLFEKEFLEEENTKDFFCNYLYIRLASNYPDCFKYEPAYEKEIKFFKEELTKSLEGYDFYKYDKYNALINFKNVFQKETVHLTKKYLIPEEKLRDVLKDVFFNNVKTIIKQKVN